jgi:hypothetical protein
MSGQRLEVLFSYRMLFCLTEWRTSLSIAA